MSVTPSQLAKLLRRTIPRRHPIMVSGAPGVGKTSCVVQACNDIRMSPVNDDRTLWKVDPNGLPIQCIVMHPVISDPTDFKGFPFVVDGAAEFLPYGDLRRLIEADVPTCVVLDDLGQAPSSVQAPAMQLLKARHIGQHKVSDLVCFVAITNRREDRAGVTGILEPVKSRFLAIVELAPHVGDWLTWAASNNIVPDITSFIARRPQFLFDFKPTPNLTNSPSPRTVEAVSDIIRMRLDEDLTFETISGAAGRGFATEFTAWSKMLSGLVDPRAFLDNPSKKDVPSGVDAAYALATGISAIAEYDDVPKVMRAGALFAKELATLMIREMFLRNPSTMEHEESTAWIAENSHLSSND